MTRLRRLTNLIGRDGVEAFVAAIPSEEVHVTARAAASLERLMPSRTHILGSVEGKLETISVHGKPRFIVYDSATHKGVACHFTETEWLDQVKAALGRLVSISGVVHLNIKAEPMRVELSDLRLLREGGDLPTIGDLGGSDPDFTGDMTTEEFVRAIRNA
jgi:hypothetical protein